MQNVSALYRSIISGTHTFEIRLVIGESGRMINEVGDVITFGGDSILVATSNAESGFAEDKIYSIRTTSGLFSSGNPSVGNCIASEIDVRIANPTADIPRMALIIPYVRVVNSTQKSEWIRKGMYYVDTRETSRNNTGLKILTLHGFDGMLKADMDYGSTSLNYPALDTAVVAEIATKMGVAVDSRTYSLMTNGYTINLPSGYTCREVLGYIGAMYCGNWCMNDQGALRLVKINEMPAQTNLLIDSIGYAIVFGSDRILV